MAAVATQEHFEKVPLQLSQFKVKRVAAMILAS
jgi:hypothetical protein